MRDRASPLRTVIDQLGIPDIRTLIQQPGTKTIYRITSYYADRKARHSVATLIDQTTQYDPQLEVVYESLFDHKPLRYTMNHDKYEAFVATLQQAHFDTLPDQPDLPMYHLSLWLVERAAGSFYHGMLFSPAQAQMPYTVIENAIDAYMPEAIRAVER